MTPAYLAFDPTSRRLRLDPHKPAFVQNPYEAYAFLHGAANAFFWEDYGFWCFGGFDVRLQGRTVPPEEFIRRKALLLLKILVMSAGNPVHRDALVEGLWPGVDPRSGVNRLHGVLHALRNATEPFKEQRRWIYVCNYEVTL